jgi:hypothetical protein
MHRTLALALSFATLAIGSASAVAQEADATATTTPPPAPEPAFDCEVPMTDTSKVFLRSVMRPVNTPSGGWLWRWTNGGAAHRALIYVPDKDKPWDDLKVVEDNWAQAGYTHTVVMAGRGTVSTAGPWWSIPKNKLRDCYCETQAYMRTYTNNKYPATPSVNGTAAAADGYAIPGKAKPPTAADPNGTSNCQEFNTMLKACLRQNGLVQVN